MVVALALAGVVAGQLLEQLALLAVELGGQLHLDGELMVAAGHRIPEPGHALALEGDDGPGLGAAGNLQRLWKEPKTEEVINKIHDQGLHFRLLTEAYDAEVAKLYPEVKP